jgi:hypothetical protein
MFFQLTEIVAISLRSVRRWSSPGNLYCFPEKWGQAGQRNDHQVLPGYDCVAPSLADPRQKCNHHIHFSCGPKQEPVGYISVVTLPTFQS